MYVEAVSICLSRATKSFKSYPLKPLIVFWSISGVHAFVTWSGEKRFCYETYLSWIFENSRTDGAYELLVHRRLGKPRHVVSHCNGNITSETYLKVWSTPSLFQFVRIRTLTSAKCKGFCPGAWAKRRAGRAGEVTEKENRTSGLR